MITQEWKEAFAREVYENLNTVHRGFGESVNEILFTLRKGVNLRNDLAKVSDPNCVLFSVDGKEDEIRKVLREYYDSGFCGLEATVEKICQIIQREEKKEEVLEFPDPLDFSYAATVKNFNIEKVKIVPENKVLRAEFKFFEDTSNYPREMGIRGTEEYPEEIDDFMIYCPYIPLQIINAYPKK